ncbi:hypothetical protein IWW40_004702 [Coemansia sp. RSA 1250]|nr:hypothetical protein IWW40_004702 [Coemansia sp. RSA 1250]
MHNVFVYVFYPMDVVTSLPTTYPTMIQIDGQFMGFMNLFYGLYQTRPNFLWHGYWAQALAYYPHMITKYAIKQVLEGIFAASSWCDEVANHVGMFVAYPLKLAGNRMIFDMAFNGTLKYSSIAEYFAITLKDGGVGLLFTGCLLEKGVYVLTSIMYKKINEMLKQQQASFTARWVKATILYGCSEILLFPAMVIRYNMQLQAVLSKELYSGILDCCAKMYAAGGIAAFYSGLGFSLALMPFLVLVLVASNRYDSKVKTE